MPVTSGMSPGLKALDLGCGEGRNAFYLAGLGFITSVIDISPSGIRKLDSVARESGLTINSAVCDMREYEFPYVFYNCNPCFWSILSHTIPAFAGIREFQ